MARRLISSSSAFESAIGYSRAVVSGDWVFVSGCTGYDYAANTLPTDVVGQAEQCMRNIVAALAGAGASVEDVVRVRYVLPDRRDFPPVWPVLRRWFGTARPAATMVQAGLLEEAMRIEIEVTARRGSAAAVAAAVVREGNGEGEGWSSEKGSKGGEGDKGDVEDVVGIL